jgi:uncharacterized protein (TIGR02231 family)
MEYDYDVDYPKTKPAGGKSMMRKLVVIMVILLSSVPLLAQDAANVVVDSKIQAVTVFSDRAMIKRTLEKYLGAGDYTIEVPHLPDALLDESIHVSGEGTAGAKISGVKIEQALVEANSSERIGEVEAQINALDDRSKQLTDRSDVLAQKKAFIEALSSKTSEGISNNLAKDRPSVTEWSGMLKFVDDGLEAINKENRDIATEQKDIELKKQTLQVKLGEIRGDSQVEKKGLIDVTIDKPGTFTFELSYMIMGAHWTPLYDVRAWSDTNEIELSYLANVNQQTGEDWNDVKIELSTARPSAGANPPELDTWFLQTQYVYPVLEKSLRAGKMAVQAALPPAPFNIAEAGKDVTATQFETAEILDQSVSTAFSIRQKQTIPSNQEFKKVPIQTITFAATDEYITVPRKNEIVYRKSAIVNNTNIPLLAGKVNVFFNSNFVSSGSIGTILPKEPFNLYFGADEGIKVKRELVNKLRDDAGLTGDKQKYSYEFKITLQNFHKTACKVTVVDQIPLSQDKDIEIKKGDIVPPLTVKEGDEQKGFLRWVLNLNPQEKTSITYKYQVKYPGDKPVYGLE